MRKSFGRARPWPCREARTHEVQCGCKTHFFKSTIFPLHRLARAVFGVIAGLLFIGTVLFAQSPEPIHGVVVDPDHAAVPEATVRLVAADGSEVAHTLTDQQGRFSFSHECSNCSL